MIKTNKTNCKEAYGSPAVNVIEVLAEGVRKYPIEHILQQ